MKNILILFAHPALQRSRVNKHLISEIKKLDFVTFHDLYEEYPHMNIDEKFEQQLLLNHDIVMFMFPFFWYSTPAILKEWQDIVLEHGWAYGKEGDKLQGKDFMCLMSTGGQASAYTAEGYNKHTLRELLLPLQQTAKLCKMNFLPPYAVQGTHSISIEEIEAHTQNIISVLTLLSNIEATSSDFENYSLMNHFISERKD